MKIFIILLFTLIYAFHMESSYSIDSLIDYLIGNGYYELIQQVKMVFGNDVAIDVCISIVETSQCEEIVRVYMEPSQTSPSPGIPRTPDDIIDFNEDSYFISEIQKLLEKADEETYNLILTIISYYDILKQTMNDDEILAFIKNVISKKHIKKH